MSLSLKLIFQNFKVRIRKGLTQSVLKDTLISLIRETGGKREKGEINNLGARLNRITNNG